MIFSKGYLVNFIIGVTWRIELRTEFLILNFEK